MLAEKSKQQEELLTEYEEYELRNKEMESEVSLLRSQVASVTDELKVYLWVCAEYTVCYTVVIMHKCDH